MALFSVATRRNNNVFITSKRRRRRRFDVMKTLSLRHYCVMCPLGLSFLLSSPLCVVVSVMAIGYVFLCSVGFLGLFLIVLVVVGRPTFHSWQRVPEVASHRRLVILTKFEGILSKGPYLPCVCMAGRALLAGYPRNDVSSLGVVIRVSPGSWLVFDILWVFPWPCYYMWCPWLS